MVVYADIDEAGAQAAAEASRAFATNPQYQAKGLRIDVTDPKSVDEAVETVAKEFGRIDYLINSAGASRSSLPPKAEVKMLTWSSLD